MNAANILNKLAGLGQIADEFNFTSGMPTNPEFAKALKAKQEQERQNVISEAADVVMSLVRQSHADIEESRVRLATARLAERIQKNRIRVVAVLREYGAITMNYTPLAAALTSGHGCMISVEEYIDNIDRTALEKAVEVVNSQIAIKVDEKATAAGKSAKVPQNGLSGQKTSARVVKTAPKAS